MKDRQQLLQWKDLKIHQEGVKSIFDDSRILTQKWSIAFDKVTCIANRAIQMNHYC